MTRTHTTVSGCVTAVMIQQSSCMFYCSPIKDVFNCIQRAKAEIGSQDLRYWLGTHVETQYSVMCKCRYLWSKGLVGMLTGLNRSRVTLWCVSDTYVWHRGMTHILRYIALDTQKLCFRSIIYWFWFHRIYWQQENNRISPDFLIDSTCFWGHVVLRCTNYFIAPVRVHLFLHFLVL